jgi:hypothetical protein
MPLCQEIAQELPTLRVASGVDATSSSATQVAGAGSAGTNAPGANAWPTNQTRAIA